MHTGHEVTQIGVEVSRPEGEVRHGMHAPARALPLARFRSFVRIHAIALAIPLYALVFTGATVVRHEAFRSHRFDLGNMTQAVWSTAHGRFLEATSAGGTQFVRLGAHIDPLLAVFAAPWLLWPSPLLLLSTQAILVSLGGLPVYWFARKH